jgi:hypothetical protein
MEGTTMPRRPTFETAEQMEQAIEQYFEDCDKGIEREIVTKQGKVVKINELQPYTVEGLAHFLGFAHRKSLFDYKQKDEFSNTISRARLKIHSHRLTQALLGRQDSKIAALDLAVNFGMQPKMQLPEGAKIIIGFTNPADQLDESGGEEPQQLPSEPMQITE